MIVVICSWLLHEYLYKGKRNIIINAEPFVHDEGSATEQNCVRDYVILQFYQDYTRVCIEITHICSSRIDCNF